MASNIAIARRPIGALIATCLLLAAVGRRTDGAEPLWIRAIDGGPFDAGIGTSIEPTADGGFVLLTRTDATLLKLDRDGQVLWHRQAIAGISLSVLGHLMASDTSLLLVGQADFTDRSRGFVLEVDPLTGAVGPLRLFGCDSPGSASNLRSIQATLAGGYVLSGETNCASPAPRIWVLRLDPWGSVEWGNAYELDIGSFVGSSRAGGAFEFAGGSTLVVGGSDANTGGGDPELAILEVDPAGGVIMAAVWRSFKSGLRAELRSDGRVMAIDEYGGSVEVDNSTSTIPTPSTASFYPGASIRFVTFPAAGGVLLAGTHLVPGRTEVDLAVVRDRPAEVLAASIGDDARDVDERAVAACETSDGGLAVFGLEGIGRIVVARLDSALGLGGGVCDELAAFPTFEARIWQNVIRVLPTVRVDSSAVGPENAPVSFVDQATTFADACFASADCSPTMATVNDLRAKRIADDVILSWREDLTANGYNLWTVADKNLIDDARQTGLPPEVVGVGGCSFPSVAVVPSCADVGGVSRGSRLFYQVRAFCDAVTEGP